MLLIMRVSPDDPFLIPDSKRAHAHKFLSLLLLHLINLSFDPQE